MEDCRRMEKRERDKRARQQIQNTRPEASLFPEPVRVEGDSSIDSKLGDYDAARSLFLEPKQARIIGITTSVTNTPQPPVQRIPPPQQQPYPVVGLGSSSTSSSGFAPPPSQNNRIVPPSSSHRYHPPHTSSLSSSQQQQQSRNSSSGTYLKQLDPKVTHNGRYPAPPNKHDTHQKSSGGSSGLGPPQPPQSSSAMMPNGRLSNDKVVGSSANNTTSGSNPNGRFQVPQAPPKQHSRYIEPPSPSRVGDVDSILKEMTRPHQPLTLIAATPRKEFENKFSFGQKNNHVYASLPPALTDTLTRQRDKTFNVPTSKLENDLELSESDDDHKKQTSTGRASPTNDNSSDSSDSGSSDSESEESTIGARQGGGADANNRKLTNCNRVEESAIASGSVPETNAWNLSKYFLKEKSVGLDGGCHDNIKHEPPNRLDDSSSPAPSPTTFTRHEIITPINPISPIDIKTESLAQDFSKANSNNNCLQLQPDQIKSETFEKSPSSSPEKVQHSDTVESDQIESVLAEAKGLAEIKPVSDLGSSSDADDTKPKPLPLPVSKSPAKKPVKRRRKVQKDKKIPNSDSSDEDCDLSSANNLSDRSRSVEKEKKGRGRPRKNPVAAPSTVSTNKSPAVTPVKNALANKRDPAVRKGGPGRRTSRQNSTAIPISREILETTTDSSSDDDRPPPTKSSILPSPTLSASAQVIPAKLAEIGSRGGSASGVPVVPVVKPHTKVDNNVSVATSKSSDDDDDDDDDDDSSSSSDNSDDERVPSLRDRASPRQQSLSEHHSSSPSHHSTSSSSEDHSDSDSESPPREDKKIRDKTKSDKLKSDTLRKLFIGSNRGEGGAKGKGQVLIVDQSEESQNHPAKDAPPIHHEKILSPIAFKQHNNNNNNSNSNNDMQPVPLTPTSNVTTTSNHLKSPRTSAAAVLIGGTTPTSGNAVSSVSSNNTSNSKSPALRTPERMPAMNINSKIHSVNNNSNVSNSNVHTISSPIICRIDLSRVQIPKAWLQNSQRMRDNTSNSNGSTQIQSAPHSDDDRLRSPKLPLTPRCGTNSSSKLNHKILDSGGSVNSSPSMNSRLVNSDSIGNQIATAASSPLSSRYGDGGGLNSKNNYNVDNVGKGHSNVPNYPYNVDNHRLSNNNSDRLSPALQPPMTQLHPSLVSPKRELFLHAAAQMNSNSSGSIKHEPIKSEFTTDEYMSSKSQTLLENKCNLYNNPKLVGRNNNVIVKTECKNLFIGNDCDRSNQTQASPIDPIGGGAHGTVPPPMTTINAAALRALSPSDEPIPKNRRKRSSSSSSSPYKEKKRKKTTTGAPLQNEAFEQLPPTNHDRLSDKYSPPSPIVQTVYKSYFEREGDDAISGQDQEVYLQEAKRLKHLADRESGHFNQVALYLKAVLYFLLSATRMEQSDRIPSAFTIYKDTLSLIKFISSKFIMHPPQHGIDNTNKVSVLSLRCQSLISLKLYTLKRGESKEAQKTISHFINKAPEIINGNTPSISPSSVSSLGSGSNTPPLHVVPGRYPSVHHFPKYSAETTYPFEVHAAYQKQALAFNYLSSAHELWEQADNIVKKGNHMDFFIDLDRVNGPLSLHSSMYEIFKYVQYGLQKLKEM